MRILVTGVSGYVGGFLLEMLLKTSNIPVEAVGFSYFTKSIECEGENVYGFQVDFLDVEATKHVIDSFRPDVVVHCAAYTNSTTAEGDPLCVRTNVEATRNLVEALPPLARIIYFSSDWVYSGDDCMSPEDIPLSPKSVYGKSKMEAEEIVRSSGHEYVILRSALIFGPPSPYGGKPCFAHWFDSKLERGEKVDLFEDEFRTPVYVKDIVVVVEFLLQEAMKETSNVWNDVYNVPGSTRLSRYDFGVEIAKHRGYDIGLLGSVRAQEVFKGGYRPKDLSMDASKLTKHGVHLRTISEALQDWFDS